MHLGIKSTTVILPFIDQHGSKQAIGGRRDARLRSRGNLAMEKLFTKVTDNIILRLLLAGLVVMVPVAISTAWVGAAYQHVYQNVSAIPIAVRLFLSGVLGAIPLSLPVGYVIERWVIAGRAARSWKWTGLRILLYMLVGGFACGLGTQIGIRLGVGTYPAIIESIYYLEAILNFTVVALIYSFIERVIEEVRRREAKLKQQIFELMIEIDQVKRARQVELITQTEYFQRLKAQAKEMRRQLKEPLPVE
jgi:hypothetical protein